jgi:hypothetical protein
MKMQKLTILLFLCFSISLVHPQGKTLEERKILADTVASRHGKLILPDTSSTRKLQIGVTGSIITSAVVNGDTLKFYINGIAYRAMKTISSGSGSVGSLDTMRTTLFGPDRGFNFMFNDTLAVKIMRDSTEFYINQVLKARLDSNGFSIYQGDIFAPFPGSLPNIVTQLLLENNTPAEDYFSTGNSPAIQLKHYSYHAEVHESQENSWYIHNWGFSTAGTAGGVLVFTNSRPSNPSMVSSFAIDEIGRTIIGYIKDQGSNYYGFWGEDFGQWQVITGGRTVIGWPENSTVSDLVVTGGILVNMVNGETLSTPCTITSGTGVPSASVSDGSIYLRRDGSGGTSFYVRESGSWVGK